MQRVIDYINRESRNARIWRQVTYAAAEIYINRTIGVSGTSPLVLLAYTRRMRHDIGVLQYHYADCVRNVEEFI